MSMQNMILKSLTGVAQPKKVKKGEVTGRSQHAHDGHKLCLKGKRRAADSRGTDWRGGGQMVEFEVQVNGHEATKKANRIQTARSFRLAARRQIRPGWTCPTLTGFLVE